MNRVVLDGYAFAIYQTQYAKQPIKAGSTERGLTGPVVRMESAMFETQYTLTLLLSVDDVTALRASYAKAAPSNLLDWIDAEGIEWNPAAGSDDDTHIYSSGVYFWSFQEPKPLSAALGWTGAQRFVSSLGLLTNAYYGVRPRPSGFILEHPLGGHILIHPGGGSLKWRASL